MSRTPFHDYHYRQYRHYEQTMQSYNDFSSPAKLAAHIDSEMSEIGKAIAAMRQSIASLHRGEISSLKSTQKATDISERMYRVVRDIGDHRAALIRNNQSYRAQFNKTLRIVREMRKISKIGENAQIDAIVVMQLQLISDAKRIMTGHKSEHVSAIRSVLNVQSANWIEFWAFSDRLDAWLREEADARRPCPDDCDCGTCRTFGRTFGRDRDRDLAAVAAATEYFAD